MKIALTGHRPERLGLPKDELDDKWDAINCWIQTTYKQLHDIDSDIEVLCGMASGSDIRFGMSLAFIDGVKLHCVLPCKEYNSNHKYYATLKYVANKWTELSEEFYRGCDNVRDQYMVDNCDVLLAIWDGNKSGGVWSTIRKAKKACKKIIYCPQEIVTKYQEKLI